MDDEAAAAAVNSIARSSSSSSIGSGEGDRSPAEASDAGEAADPEEIPRTGVGSGGSLEMSSQQQQQHAGEAPASAAAAARARLRWTGQLHERFVLAVAELGGADSKPHPRAFLLLLPPLTSLIMGMADRSALFLGAIAGATPKSVLRAMAVPGLTLYHLKSHLQVRACVRHAAGELSPAADQLLANSVCIGSWFLTVLSSLPLLQKYRQAVSRGGNGGGGGSGSLNDRSSSSERQPADHDGDSAADEPRTIAYDGDSDGDAKEALRDSSRSMVQMQREVQRKLQEQIEVKKKSSEFVEIVVICQLSSRRRLADQWSSKFWLIHYPWQVKRHLQLRMEAQGRYLQSVLRRAQQVLADHSLASSPEAATAELSELASAVDIECMSSSSPPRHHRQSAATDSCVTTTSSSEAESKAAGSKRLHTSDCTVEQPVQGKRTFNFLQRHNQADQEEEQEEEYAGAEDGSSSEIDLNR